MTLVDHLRTELRGAMKARDRAAVAALREAIAAIANAETGLVSDSATTQTLSEHVAGAAAAGRAERIVREQTDDEMATLARALVAERRAQADHLRELGRPEAADALAAEADALTIRLDAYPGS
ncbi:MAG: hypothetical protein QM628_14405 [Propionicimonas sp.]